MFTIAIFIGIYSYIIFLLGIFGILTKENINIISSLYILLIVFSEKKKLQLLVNKTYLFKIRLSRKEWDIYLMIALIVLQIVVNLIGTLGPELAFDALWYHLTLPKLYLIHHAIYHIPGGLLYYSDMPKLSEMLYTSALSLGNGVLSKLVHFSFGILILICLYKFSRKFFTRDVSILIIIIFYSNLVVDWESITAYVDLTRTFFELLSLWSLVNWYESEKIKWFIMSAFMIGLAISTKVLAVGSFLILFALLIVIFISKKKSIKELIGKSLLYIVCSFVVPLPWFIFSFIHTGNPVFPFFTNLYEVSATQPNLVQAFTDLWNLFMFSADPISPLYLIFFPLIFIFYSKMKKEIKFVILYSGLSLILWYFTPRTGGGRFILPYLPAFSFICGAIYSEILKKTVIEWRYITKILFITIIFVALLSIGYRGIANSRYLPVIQGSETKQQFLSNNLNFKYGDFYDTDEYFNNHIHSTDIVLLYGVHNLYYIDFPFVDSSWIRKEDEFNYIATQNSALEPRFKKWLLVYSNARTMVKLYKPPKGACLTLCKY